MSDGSSCAQFAEDLKATPIVAILRGITPASAVAVARALYDGGIRFLEVTMDSPEPVESISRISAQYAGAGLHVGAGTVLKPEEADAAAAAGATFLVSPNFDPAVVRRTKDIGLISIPGFFSPSEAFAASAAGADYLKCFPAEVLGVGYLKALKAVLTTPVIAFGGVNLGNVSQFLEVVAGAGIGSNLYSPQKDLADIRRDAASFISSAKTQI